MRLRTFHRGELSLPTHVRDFNRAAVLQRLFRGGPMSRADLARQIGLTKVTVSALIAGLVEEGVVRELGPDSRPGTPGKRGTLVALCEDQRRIVAVDLTRDGHLSGATMTLTGESMDHSRLDDLLPLGDEGVDELTRFCRTLIDVSQVPVLGVGVSTPGVVTGDGVILRAPKREWFGLDLQHVLGERLGLPVTVANDANCAALGEFAFGETDGDSVLSILVGDGIGAGLVVAGSLVHGSSSAAGEIAHITATTAGDGAPWGEPQTCVCGRRGCLETLLSEPLLREAIAGLSPAERTAWLTAVGERLGAVLAPVAALLDLSDIVIAGPEDLLAGPVVEAARAALTARIWPAMNHVPTLGLSRLEDRAPLVGAGVLVLSSTLGIP